LHRRCEQIAARPRRDTPIDIAREKVSDRAREQPGRRGFRPAMANSIARLPPSPPNPAAERIEATLVYRHQIVEWVSFRCSGYDLLNRA
jgi:hypothetical protein